MKIEIECTPAEARQLLGGEGEIRAVAFEEVLRRVSEHQAAETQDEPTEEVVHTWYPGASGGSTETPEESAPAWHTDAAADRLRQELPAWMSEAIGPGVTIVGIDRRHFRNNRLHETLTLSNGITIHRQVQGPPSST